MEMHSEGMAAQAEVICMTEQGRSEAELAFQVYKMLDGNEAFSNVSEYHMVPVQAADGSIVGVQVTGVQRGEEGSGNFLPTQLIQLHNVEEPSQPQVEQPLPEPSVTTADPPMVDLSLSEAAQELKDGNDNLEIFAAASEETSKEDETAEQLSEDVGVTGQKILYQCGQCQFSSFMLSALRRHMRKHSCKYRCHICGKTFSCTSDLRLHVNAHMGIRPFKCKDCDMTYRTATDLLRHTRSAHTFEKPFKCCYCDYSSVEANRMKVHIRSHTGERPFACSECSFAATDHFKLRRHLRTHTGEKPYNCDVCQARFTQNASLKMHILRKHTENVQKERCHICNAVLFGKNDVKVHIRKQHTYLDAPIKCRLCSEEFHERYLYRQHQESHRSRKTVELKSGKQNVEGDEEKVYELNEQEAEVSTTEEGVSWNIIPTTGEAQLFLNYQEGEQPHTLTELHSIPMQAEDGSIVQAIVLQSGEQVNPETMHAEVYEVQDLGQVLQPLVEQQSCEPIVITLDSANQAVQSAEQQGVSPDLIPQAASTPQPSSIKGRRLQPIGPNQQIEVKLHQCKDCEQAFSTGMELLKHKKLHKPENVFKCPFCENESSGALELILHIQVHNDDRPFQCEQCNFSTTDSFKLTRHKRTHTGEKPFTCNICQAKFTQKTSMLMHIQRKHTKELPKLNCHLCSTVLTGKHSLNIHLRKQHSHLETELKCRFCPATFRERFVLREHQKTHRNEKPIKSTTPRAKRRKTAEKSQDDQVNFEEQEPVVAAQAEEYTWQVLPPEQETEIHFVISEAEDANSVTEYHVLPMEAEEASVISIQVSGLQEMEQIEAGAIHQVVLREL
ncbi:uncharacterized protein [Pyxicephalus adspersus]|uniref:uncharacterized protein isoform X2 n=1 Tax=Pyxicephalus adspersus TaxID=30357 RepID=UPI003B5B9AED